MEIIVYLYSIGIGIGEKSGMKRFFELGMVVMEWRSYSCNREEF